jgi:radical SAM superfamily enzyme YgiQ (UPF0313 family)
MKILLITPPLTHLNTPYPATTVLKAYLEQKKHEVYQRDLGIELVNTIFTKTFLQKIIGAAILTSKNRWFLEQKDRYLNAVEPVLRFLQGKEHTLALRIATETFLPQGFRFNNNEDLEWAYGVAGQQDKSRHLATLFIEDIADFIRENVAPNFSLVRYADRIATGASTFDSIEKELQKPSNIVDELMLDIFGNYLKDLSPDLVGFTIPFPGNLYASLKCGQLVKSQFPNIKVVTGGGYVNTELRSLTDVRIFSYLDFLSLDDGELPLERICDYLSGKSTENDLVRTFYTTSDKKLIYSNNNEKNVRFSELKTPSFSGLPFDKYISLVELSNPMHKMWTDGLWNKLTAAHGCYWAKCAFCDTSLDYIARYEALTAAVLLDKMLTVAEETGSTGFHFIDEALPPKLLHDLADEIFRKEATLTYWGNIRFEASYTRELCEKLAKSGLVAVSGGLEVATNRLLSKINKGVTLEQTIQSAANFVDAGVLVHAYLMYGFPTESIHETIDSLEVVRQLFDEGLIHSAFWHRTAMTVHSPLGCNPQDFGAERLDFENHPFANNDVSFSDGQIIDLDMIGKGLKKAAHNFMHGIGLDFPLQKWFEQKISATTIPPNFVRKLLNS